MDDMTAPIWVKNATSGLFIKQQKYFSPQKVLEMSGANPYEFVYTPEYTLRKTRKCQYSKTHVIIRCYLPILN